MTIPATTEQQLRQTIQRLRTELAKASQFMEHAGYCEERMTDFCTCGMADAKRHVRQMYEETA